MVDRFQHNAEFLVLTLLGLCHLGHVQLFAGQLLPELVQHLAIVHVLFQLLDNDALLGKLIVDPIDENLLQLQHLRIVVRLRINNGALFMLT